MVSRILKCIGLGTIVLLLMFVGWKQRADMMQEMCDSESHLMMINGKVYLCLSGRPDHKASDPQPDPNT